MQDGSRHCIGLAVGGNGRRNRGPDGQESAWDERARESASIGPDDARSGVKKFLREGGKFHYLSAIVSLCTRKTHFDS